MVDNRRPILFASARLFCDRGFDAVSVAEIMTAAGLTRGGFYRHFASQNDLIAQTVAHAMSGQGDRTPHG